MQAEDDFIHKVLDITVLRSSHKHHPVMSEALRCGLLTQLSSVAQLQLYLHRALRGEREWRMTGREKGGGGVSV